MIPLNVEAIETQLARLLRLETAWDTQYSELHAAYEDMRELRRPDHQSDPRIGKILGKALQTMNNRGRLAVKGQVSVYKRLLDTAKLMAKQQDELADVKAQLMGEFGVVMENVGEVSPAPTNWTSNIAIAVLQAQLVQTKKTLAAQVASVDFMKKRFQAAPSGKHKGLLGHQVSTLSEAARASEETLKLLETAISNQTMINDVSIEVQQAEKELKSLRSRRASEHYRVLCPSCGTTVSSCRCLGPHTIRYEICDSCASVDSLELTIRVARRSSHGNGNRLS